MGLAPFLGNDSFFVSVRHNEETKKIFPRKSLDLIGNLDKETHYLHDVEYAAMQAMKEDVKKAIKIFSSCN